MFSGIVSNTSSTYFNSVCLTIVSLVFMILITVMYVSKKKESALSSKIFTLMIIFCFSSLILEMICPYFIEKFMEEPEKYEVINDTINRIYLFITYGWGISILAYVPLVAYGEDYYNVKSTKRTLSFIAIPACVIFAIVDCFVLEFEYFGNLTSG